VPYLKLPSGGYRIPQASLLASLRGNYDLAGELAKLDKRFADVTEELIGDGKRDCVGGQFVSRFGL
jgi:hypothetical protein